MAVNLNRKYVEIAKKRVPLTRILNGEISDVIAAIKAFRTQFAEQEILYKAKVHLNYGQGEAIASVRRLETDNEYNKRVAEERKEEEAKAERKRIREEKNQIRAEKRAALVAAAAEEKRLADIALVKKMARDLGLSTKDLIG